MVYTYLIFSKKIDKFYTGISIAPTERLATHNRGILRVTRNGRPWKLVYVKQHIYYKYARKHEQWLKKKDKTYKRNLA